MNGTQAVQEQATREQAVQEVEPITYTPQQARRVIGVGQTMIYKLLHSGQLPAQRAGYRWLISRDKLMEWVNGQAVTREE